jgi:twitching motility protein PilT
VTLLESLLDAIVRLEGDALVMHVGEKPYVVTTSSSMNAYRGPLAWGQVELSSRVLTPDAVLNMVGQILPVDQRHALEEVGAVEHPIQSPAGVADRFTVVAARGGEDIWLELRRHPAVLERDARGRGAVEASSSDTAAAATHDGASTAVGLQEPPPANQDPAHHAAATSEDAVPPSGDTPSVDADRAALTSPPDTTPVERIPVLDEVALHDTEHVEHILIPLEERESEAAVGAGDGALEIVEPEIQRSPTEEDVESIIASTAAALLAASVTSTPGDLQGIEITHIPEQDGSEQPFVVGTDDSGQPQEVDFGEGAVDLTAALDEMPAPSWSSAQTEAQPEVVAEQAGVPAAESDVASESITLDVSRPGPRVDVGSVAMSEADVAEPPVDVAAEPASTARNESENVDPSVKSVAVTEPARGVEAVSAAADGIDEDSHSMRAVETQQIAVPGTHDGQDQPTLIHPEIAVEKTASVSAAETPPAAPASRIAAAATGVPHPGGVITPIGRDAGRPERPASGRRVDDESAVQLLRAAAERGASTVYVVAQSKPMIRIDGDISPLDDSQVLTDADVERLIATLEPHRAGPASAAVGTEWISEVAQVGRVRCVTFRDHHGPGIIFRLIPARAISADHLHLSPQIRELAALADGLVLVAGARGCGKSTLLNSFVDLINGSRGEHVIVIEAAIGFVHQNQRSFVSQREVGDDIGAAAAAASAALREDPDVLVIDELKSADAVKTALEAAQSGRLVFASITAPSAGDAIEALVNLVPAAERAAVRASLAAVLRGAVAQVLLRKSSGGHVAARELLLSSPAVTASIRQGESAGLGKAIEEGARHGMVRLTDSLASLIKEGAVHGGEAYRRAPDREGLLGSLARDGVDTSFAERLA